jgi:hypothetical protein
MALIRSPRSSGSGKWVQASRRAGALEPFDLRQLLNVWAKSEAGRRNLSISWLKSLKSLDSRKESPFGFRCAGLGFCCGNFGFCCAGFDFIALDLDFRRRPDREVLASHRYGVNRLLV